jgi:hypothetical protein
MKIEQIDLKAYGHFTNQRLALGGAANLHIICGPNEAGKTTLWRAINGALFGIPERTQDGFPARGQKTARRSRLDRPFRRAPGGDAPQGARQYPAQVRSDDRRRAHPTRCRKTVCATGSAASVRGCSWPCSASTTTPWCAAVKRWRKAGAMPAKASSKPAPV